MSHHNDVRIQVTKGLDTEGIRIPASVFAALSAPDFTSREFADFLKEHMGNWLRMAYMDKSRERADTEIARIEDIH